MTRYYDFMTFVNSFMMIKLLIILKEILFQAIKKILIAMGSLLHSLYMILKTLCYLIDSVSCVSTALVTVILIPYEVVTQFHKVLKK